MNVKIKTDLFPVVEMGYKYWLKEYLNSPILPILNGYNRIFVRGCIIRSDSDRYILSNKMVRDRKIIFGLPVEKVFSSDSSVIYPLLRIFLLAFGLVKEPKIHGIISVEHNANAHPKERNDGLCLTILAEPDSTLVGHIKEPFSWKLIESDCIRNEIKNKVDNFESIVLHNP